MMSMLLLMSIATAVWRMRLLVTSLLMLLHGHILAFAPCATHRGRAFCTEPATCHYMMMMMAKRNKLSAKERRKRRAKQLQLRPISGKPVNFDKLVDTHQQMLSSTDTPPPTERAQQLLEAQRKSVDMLTHVRERVESLNYQEIQSSLTERGYSVVDDFLQRKDIIDELQQEGLSLFEKEDMEVDLSNLGSGEYVCKIEGGEEQYKLCPRSVEFVVSVTKHMAPAFEGSNLDPSACMATMRTFDRKARDASRELLSKELSERPLDLVAKDDKDARKISLLYYPQDGGGISFENGETVPAKRDRLFLIKSDSCLHRKALSIGDEDNANCIELHLIEG